MELRCFLGSPPHQRVGRILPASTLHRVADPLAHAVMSSRRQETISDAIATGAPALAADVDCRWPRASWQPSLRSDPRWRRAVLRIRQGDGSAMSAPIRQWPRRRGYLPAGYRVPGPAAPASSRGLNGCHGCAVRSRGCSGSSCQQKCGQPSCCQSQSSVICLPIPLLSQVTSQMSRIECIFGSVCEPNWMHIWLTW